MQVKWWKQILRSNLMQLFGVGFYSFIANSALGHTIDPGHMHSNKADSIDSAEHDSVVILFIFVSTFPDRGIFLQNDRRRRLRTLPGKSTNNGAYKWTHDTVDALLTVLLIGANYWTLRQIVWHSFWCSRWPAIIDIRGIASAGKSSSKQATIYWCINALNIACSMSSAQ